MAVFTTGVDIADFIALSGQEFAKSESLLDLCAEAVSDWLTARCRPFEDDETLPAQLKYAARLAGARLYRRASATEGASVIGDNIIYVSGTDRDVEQMIGRFLTYDGFA